MYPYFDLPNTKGNTCQTSKDNVAILIDHYVRLKVDKEEDLLYLLAYYGPVVTSKFYNLVDILKKGTSCFWSLKCEFYIVTLTSKTKIPASQMVASN